MLSQIQTALIAAAKTALAEMEAELLKILPALFPEDRNIVQRFIAIFPEAIIVQNSKIVLRVPNGFGCARLHDSPFFLLEDQSIFQAYTFICRHYQRCYLTYSWNSSSKPIQLRSLDALPAVRRFNDININLTTVKNRALNLIKIMKNNPSVINDPNLICPVLSSAALIEKLQKQSH